MQYETVRALADEWHVEAIDDEGCCYVTIFYGVKAQNRAEEYAAWKNGFPSCLVEPVGGKVGDLARCAEYPNCPCGGPPDTSTANRSTGETT